MKALRVSRTHASKRRQSREFHLTAFRKTSCSIRVVASASGLSTREQGRSRATGSIPPRVDNWFFDDEWFDAADRELWAGRQELLGELAWSA